MLHRPVPIRVSISYMKNVLRLAFTFCFFCSIAGWGAQGGITVKLDNTLLKKGCGPGDEPIDHLSAGANVEIRSGIDGCYFVTVRHQGKTWYGFLPAEALNGVERVESERKAAPSIGIGAARIGRPPVQLPSNISPEITKAVELLSVNQPQQALELIEGELKKTPGDAKLLELAGIAAYRADELASAVVYLKNALEMDPDSGLEAIFKRVIKEFDADRTMKKLVGLRVQLRYLPGVLTEETAHAILTLLDREYTRISDELGCRSTERLTAIAQTLGDYQKTIDAAEWSVGQFDGRIRVAMLEPGGLGEQTRRTFSHEMVHACLANIGPWPAWLHEGLAQRLSGQTYPPVAKAKLTEAMRLNTVPKLNRMTQTWSRMSPEHAALAYSLAFFAVETFYVKFKEYGIRNLLSNPQRLPSIADEIDKAMGH